MRLHPRLVASLSQTTHFLNVHIKQNELMAALGNRHLQVQLPASVTKTKYSAQLRNGRTTKQGASLIMGKSAPGALDYQMVEKNLEGRWQLLYKKLTLTNRLENFASAWRQKMFQTRTVQAAIANPSRRHMGHLCEFGAIWLGDWLTAGLAVYCHIISHCLPLFNRRPSSCHQEAFVSRKEPDEAWRLPQRLTPQQCQPVTATEAAKTPLGLQSLSPLAHVRHNLPSRAWPGPCQGSGFTRGAH